LVNRIDSHQTARKIRLNTTRKEITPYEDFRNKVYSKLKAYKYGLTWSEIRQKAGLKQTVPYNGWTKRLEKDIGLKRERDSRGVVWMLVRSW
jgi:hypothetical protein